MSDFSFQGVLFDLDGTLIDTESLAMSAQEQAFAAFGLEPDAALFHRFVGVDDVTVRAMIRDHYDFDEVEALDALVMERMAALMREGIPFKPGVEEVLDRLDTLALPRAIVTSSRAAQAALKLEVTGLGRWFDTVVTVADVTTPKPHPEAYLAGAARLGLPPAACVAFEDSETGAASAHGAGCTVVQVPDILPATGDFAHHVAPTLPEGARAVGLMG